MKKLVETFEAFLIDKHAKDYHGTDDDMPDDYEHWVSNLDGQEIIDLAEEWGNDTRDYYIASLEEIRNILTK